MESPSVKEDYPYGERKMDGAYNGPMRTGNLAWKEDIYHEKFSSLLLTDRKHQKGRSSNS
jgi:hypothetical protein